MQSNPTSQTFPVEIKGKTYILHFSRGDYADAEWSLGRSLVSDMSFFAEVDKFQRANNSQLPVRYLEIALFVGLQRYIGNELLPEPQPIITVETKDGPRQFPGPPDNPVAGFNFRQLRDYTSDIDTNSLFKQVIDGLLASMPPPPDKNTEEPKPSADPLALAQPNGGSEPGPSADSTSA